MSKNEVKGMSASVSVYLLVRGRGEKLNVELHAHVSSGLVSLLIVQIEPLRSDPAPIRLLHDVRQRDLHPVPHISI
jgi:hypothetical protein